MPRSTHYSWYLTGITLDIHQIVKLRALIQKYTILTLKVNAITKLYRLRNVIFKVMIVKDQGKCGSIWEFSIIRVIEEIEINAIGKFNSLSK